MAENRTDVPDHRSQFLEAAGLMLEELVRAGIDVSDFGRFGSLYPSAFDFSRATPILIDVEATTGLEPV
jgi:hypothetical protein